jgi:AcrR family transcriptional regulator
VNSADRHQAVRDALIAAAEDAIAAHGLAGLKAREIAREANCAVGTIYTVFADLDALVLTVNARTLEAIDAELRAVLATNAGKPAKPVTQLMDLAAAYLDYASRNRQRWDALFAHRMADGRQVPDWYRAPQAKLFQHLETPLAALCPGLSASELSVLGRTLFSAVHGVVSLGLDQKLSPMPPEVLRAHTRSLVEILAKGLDGSKGFRVANAFRTGTHSV